MLATPRGRKGARRLLLLTLASTASALRLHRVPNGGASPLARREALALGLASGLAVSTQPVSADTPPTAAAPPTAARSVRESIEALRAAPPSDSGKPLPSRSLFTRRYFTRETADVEYPSWFQGSWKCTSTLEQVRPEHSPSPSRSRSRSPSPFSLTLTFTLTRRWSRPVARRSSLRDVTAPRRCMPPSARTPD